MEPEEELTSILGLKKPHRARCSKNREKNPALWIKLPRSAGPGTVLKNNNTYNLDP